MPFVWIDLLKFVAQLVHLSLHEYLINCWIYHTLIVDIVIVVAIIQAPHAITLCHCAMRLMSMEKYITKSLFSKGGGRFFFLQPLLCFICLILIEFEKLKSPIVFCLYNKYMIRVLISSHAKAMHWQSNDNCKNDNQYVV